MLDLPIPGSKQALPFRSLHYRCVKRQFWSDMVTDTSIIPALSKPRQKDAYKLEASLDIKTKQSQKATTTFVSCLQIR